MPTQMPRPERGASAALAVPKTFPWLPEGLQPEASESRRHADRMLASLRAARDELGLAAARYNTFRAWLYDEARTAFREAEAEGLADDDPMPERLRALMDVIHRLPEG